MIHHNAQLSLLCLVDFLESDDVGMVEHLENLSLSESTLLVRLAHLLDIDLFDDCI